MQLTYTQTAESASYTNFCWIRHALLPRVKTEEVFSVQNSITKLIMPVQYLSIELDMSLSLLLDDLQLRKCLIISGQDTGARIFKSFLLS